MLSDFGAVIMNRVFVSDTASEHCCQQLPAASASSAASSSSVFSTSSVTTCSWQSAAVCAGIIQGTGSEQIELLKPSTSKADIQCSGMRTAIRSQLQATIKPSASRTGAGVYGCCEASSLSAYGKTVFGGSVVEI